MSEYEENISGFKVTGDWSDIVEHGEKISFALQELNYDTSNEDVDEYNNWRPKASENIREDINKKTAEQAMISETKEEKEANKPQEDMKIASEKVIYSYKDLGEPEMVFKDWIDSLNYAARAFNVATRKSVRQVEKSLYENVMTVVSPYYFDNELISANVSRVSNNPHEYELEVNINDDSLKSEVSKKLNKYENKYGRWHVSSQKDTEAINLVEGVEDINESEENKESNPNPKCT